LQDKKVGKEERFGDSVDYEKYMEAWRER